jgi:hypothetical protein
VGTLTFKPINSITQQIWKGDGTTTSITINTNWAAVSPYTDVFAPFTITITDGASTIHDDGAGNLTDSGNFAVGGTVNYSTGVVHVNFTAAPATTVIITLSAQLIGDYFTGDNTEFFNSTNWLGYLFLTNNKDPITLFNGITKTLSRPPFSITQAHFAAFVNDVATCLDLDVYKNRLIVERPVPVGGTVLGQTFYWSAIVQNFGGDFGAQASPTNLVQDIISNTGHVNGGFLVAPTDDFIMSSEFLRDYLVVQFENSTWTFRFTNNGFDPFRFDKINATKRTNAPYATIPYDERVTSAGATGLIACDGVNVQRYDVKVIDQWLQIDQNFFNQCFSIRSDSINQSWMLYPSIEVGGIGSDAALIYNFLEDTWAVYDWTLTVNPTFSCLGLYNIVNASIWNDFAAVEVDNQWDHNPYSWNSYQDQALSPDIIGGDSNGGIWIMDTGETDGSAIFEAVVTSTQWNPYFPQGQRCEFGYIDFYYEVNNLCELTLTFTVSNDPTTTIQRTITLTGSNNSQTKQWQRVYIHMNGEFLNMTMQDNGFPWKIYGLLLWTQPGGRLTPGFTL